MSPLLTAYLILGIAILFEVAGSSFLMKTEHFTKPLPTLLTLVFYGFAFYALSLALKHIPLGVAYAIWSGVGIVLTALIGVVIFRQSLDWAAVIGMGFIILGVGIMNLFSKAGGHG